MAANIITQEDLEQFKVEFIADFKSTFMQDITEALSLLKPNNPQNELGRLLKSHQVQRMLSISPGKLQTLRNTGKLPYSNVGGTIFYAYGDVVEMIESNKNNYANSK